MCSRKRRSSNKMSIFYSILSQIGKVLFCLFVIGSTSANFGSFEVIVVSLFFFLYAYVYNFHVQSNKHRNAQYYSLILSLKEMPGIGQTVLDFQQMFVKE